MQCCLIQGKRGHIEFPGQPIKPEPWLSHDDNDKSNTQKSGSPQELMNVSFLHAPKIQLMKLEIWQFGEPYDPERNNYLKLVTRIQFGMGLSNIDGNELVTVLLIAGIPIIVWMWALIDVLRNDFKSGTSKTIWIIIVLLVPMFGSILYLLIGRSRRVK